MTHAYPLPVELVTGDLNDGRNIRYSELARSLFSLETT
jgi:hypothetical protein